MGAREQGAPQGGAAFRCGNRSDGQGEACVMIPAQPPVEVLEAPQQLAVGEPWQEWSVEVEVMLSIVVGLPSLLVIEAGAAVGERFDLGPCGVPP